MNFRFMCMGYAEMSQVFPQVTARRKIWPRSVHVLLGITTTGPMATVMSADDGTDRTPTYTTFKMDLVLNGETMILGWCPPIEDVMGQDWEIMRGK